MAAAGLGLFETLSGLGAQCWFTGTDRALFAGLDGETQYYSVDDGVLSPNRMNNDRT